MNSDNISEHLLSWTAFLLFYAYIISMWEDLSLYFGLKLSLYNINNPNLIVKGYQLSYLTKVNQSLKTVDDYEEDFILLCCHILRTRTEEDIQELIKQILCIMKTRTIKAKSFELDEDLHCEISMKYSSPVLRGKLNALSTHTQFRIFSKSLSHEEILHHMRLIREHYIGVIGYARPECVSEMYTHLYNEPCLIDEDQLNQVNKTPKEILDCYHRYPNDPEKFLKFLLRNK